MRRRFVSAACLLLLVAAGVAAFEAVGTIKKVDAEKGVLFIHANGQDRTVKVAKDAKVRDTKGKELPDGLKAAELKEGTEVTITVERDGNEPVIKAIQLGKSATKPDQPKSEGKASVGLKPLPEMTAQDRYKGEDGGLYGGGKNEPPAAHAAAAKKETGKITPLDKDGKPAKEGRIVLISMSMSNATQEFSTFKRVADADPQKSPLLTIVDCAQGGQTMAAWANAQNKCWEVADNRLTQAGVTPKQVQIVWIKLANAGPKGDLTEHGKKLEKDTIATIQNAKAHFPNLRVAYLDSRIYGGYATTQLNPEPYAYEGAFVVRWVVQDQIKGDAALNYDAEKGAVKAPVLLWGAYLWGDGTTPRKSDGLIWERKDLAGDGTHPTASGQQKVAGLLLNFFKTDGNAKTWFVKP
jgi:hypothetical protein